MSGQARRGVGAAVAAVALTVLVTWPLARCLGTCLGPPPDTLVSVYFLAWVARALTSPGVRLLDAPMFAPYANTLALGEYLPAYAPIAIPAISLTGNPVVAHSVVLLILYAGAAVGVYALGQRLFRATGPAALAAIGFAFSPRLLDQSYNLQTLSIAWVPWIYWALERFVGHPTLARASLLVPLALGLALSSMNVFAFTGLALVLWLGVAMVTGRVRGGHLVRLAAAGGVTAGLVWGYVGPYRRAAREWDLGRTLMEVETGATTLGHLIRLPPESLLRWAISGDGRGGTPVEGVLLSVALAGLAVAGLVEVWRDRQGAGRALLPHVVVMGAALVLALGPTLHTAWGAYPLPYRALYTLVPGFGAIRTPGRFLLFVDLGVALLAGAGAARLLAGLRRSSRRLAFAALGLLMLAEAVLIPFPGAVPRLDPATLPEAYRWLRTRPAGTVALGVPMGDWVNVAASALHLHRTVNGWASFEPPRYRDLVAAMEAFPDARTLALVRGIPVDVVLIDRTWLTRGRAARLEAPGSGLRSEKVFPTHVLYRPEGPPPAGPATLQAEGRRDLARTCVALRNPGSGWVPLYPARRITLAARGVAASAWLPLDLAPGAEHVECLPPGDAETVSGTIEGAGRRLRFVIAPGRPAAPIEEASH